MKTSLPFRSFGPDGLRTTALGQGGAVINRSSRADGVATIRAALEAGIRYFDTSPGYCGNESQAVFGEGLARAGDDVMVATKVGYFEDPADYRSPRAITKQIQDNLRRLRRERVDLLQVHEANWSAWWKDGGDRTRISASEDYDFSGAPVFEALHQARDRGLCRYIGITGNTAFEMERVLQAVTVDTFLIAYNYDVIFRTAETEAIPLARRKKAVVILGAIFYGGRLVAPHPEWLESPPEWMDADLQSRFRDLYRIQKESGLTLVELGVRFSLSQANASVVLVGTRTPAETMESVRAAQAGPLPRDVHRRIEALALHRER